MQKVCQKLVYSYKFHGRTLKTLKGAQEARGDALLLNVHSWKQLFLLNTTSSETPAFRSVLATMQRCSACKNSQ